MNRSTFNLPKMDCAAEEQLVRMALGREPSVKRVGVDLLSREIAVYHEGETGPSAGHCPR